MPRENYAKLEQDYRDFCRRATNTLTLVRSDLLEDPDPVDAASASIATAQEHLKLVRTALTGAIEKTPPEGLPVHVWNMYVAKLADTSLAVQVVERELAEGDVEAALRALSHARRVADYRCKRPPWGHFGGIARPMARSQIPYKTRQTIVYVDGRMSQGGEVVTPGKRLGINLRAAFEDNLRDMNATNQ